MGGLNLSTMLLLVLGETGCGKELIARAPELAFYPGFLIFITVIAVNFVGDGLQDAFDPRADSH